MSNTDKKEEPKKDVKDDKAKGNKKLSVNELLAQEELVSIHYIYVHKFYHYLER